MLHWLKRKADTRRIGHEIYERIVAQARDPVFFRDMRVPDTMEGRLEMIVLHLALMLDRLKTEGAAGQRLGQHLMEHLVADFDDALRQIGIGDMGVPRRVQKAAAAFTERNQAYRAALGEAAGDRLETALATHVYGAGISGAGIGVDEALAAAATGAARLAAYVRAAAWHLANVPADRLFEGRGLFQAPEPAPAAAQTLVKEVRP